VENRVKALVQYAGGRDPGPLAVPSDEADAPEHQQVAGDQLTPPVPRDPWNDAGNRTGGSVGAPPGPSEGPWGRHS
jgi:heat shock protein HtpX